MTASAPTAPPNASHGALETLKPTSLFGYGLGDFGCNLAFSLSTAWLLFYYTDVAGLNAGLIATMFFDRPTRSRKSSPMLMPMRPG